MTLTGNSSKAFAHNFEAIITRKRTKAQVNDDSPIGSNKGNSKLTKCQKPSKVKKSAKDINVNEDQLVSQLSELDCNDLDGNTHDKSINDGVSVGVNDSEDEFRESGQLTSEESSDSDSDESLSSQSSSGSSAISDNDSRQCERSQSLQGRYQATELRMEELKRQIRQDPEMQSLVAELVLDELHNNGGKSIPKSRKSKGKLVKDYGKVDHRSDQMLKGSVVKNTPIKAKSNQTTETQIIKSPPDTTLYKPALQKGRESELISQISNFVENIQMESKRPGSSRYDETEH